MDGASLILSPPVAFAIVLGAFMVLAGTSKVFALRRVQSAEQSKPYACGEDLKDHMIQPDYSQFFPFAFYFTILHVIALVAATVPVSAVELQTAFFALIYLAGAVVGLLVLYRR